MSAETADVFFALDRSGGEFDVWRAAHLLVEQHGHEDAQQTAAFLASARKARGDRSGQRIWLRVMMAVRELRRGYRRKSEFLN